MSGFAIVYIHYDNWFRGKFVYLEDISCKVKDNCTDHAPWPQGICSKCQPSAITLGRQVITLFSLVICLLGTVTVDISSRG